MKPDELALSFDLPKRTVALVLAGGRGSRLMDLTDRRAKPAVYFGGKFRLLTSRYPTVSIPASGASV